MMSMERSDLFVIEPFFCEEGKLVWLISAAGLGVD